MQNSLSTNQGKDYIKFLEEIYGKRNVANIVRFEENVVKFVPKTKLFEYLNKTTLENGYNNKTKELSMQCESCKEFYNILKPTRRPFMKRNMDFPSWIDELDFTDLKKSKKKIMVVGESVTGTFSDLEHPEFGKIDRKRKLNLSFELGTMVNNLEDLQYILKKKVGKDSNRFWTKIATLFSKDNKSWLNDLYITDLAHCNCSGHQVLYLPCAKEYFLKEVELIKPKFILVQGNIATSTIFKLFKNQTTNFKQLKKKNPSIDAKYYRYGKKQRKIQFKIDKKDYEIIIFSIPHTAWDSDKKNASNKNNVISEENMQLWKKIGLYVQKNFTEIFKN